MKELLKKGINTVRTVADKAADELISGYSIVKEKVNGLPIFISIQKYSQYVDIQYDEKHYFVIPYHLSEHTFALHTMRCLPDSVPEINNLPKRRIFHFPNVHYEVMLKEYMRQCAGDVARERSKDNLNSLESLANDIDSLDKKLTYGMLLVGGLAAVANPVLGAGIAAKALLPGVGSLLNKYGLRPAGEKLSNYQIEKSVKEAEENIAKQFAESSTLQVINPILQELELALRTTESEHDPLIDPNLSNAGIPELHNERWRQLTEIAICRVYKEVYEDSRLHKEARLGPEDLRWLKIMFEINKD
ncbi:hypothetical protein [Psychromonas aquimarina]|uniref:hypothetical protein n=1 Tax=Psychromonas aquimarina TaxID=444919 RepID=UPI00040ED8A1|nr:hypothetical protein [Psychromonas aquimarina]